MESLARIESFVRSAETGSFSAAARLLGLTPAGVSKNVAMLERALGVRLFHRSTRRLTLTEAGESFLLEVSDGLNSVQAAVANASRQRDKPAGVLRVSLAFAFGQQYILPLLARFMEQYPDIQPDWRFENRQVDLINEGLDAAIGGGIDLAPGVVARELARAQLVTVAAPCFLANKTHPVVPQDLFGWDGIMRRSSNTGRIQPWHLQTITGELVVVEPRPRVILNDPEAICQAAASGLGVGLVPHSHALPYLQQGQLIRLLPQWCYDAGPVSIYFASAKMLPAKTRVFVDFIVAHFRQEKLAQKFSAW
ncbi:LysR family transcriptional regulator [Cellvibrio sp. PSBB006]|nr:LysR family transcriptional regulator [Cellvibrio sp. PSBB006]